MTESNSVEPQPASDVNLLAGGDQPLVVEPAACSTRGCWSTRIMRAVVIVAVLGSAGAYGALQANPNLANYIPLGSTIDRMPGIMRDHCPLSGDCPLSASAQSNPGCCSAARAALDETASSAETLATGESPTCPHCRPDSSARADAGAVSSADATPTTPESAESANAATEAPAVAEPASEASDAQ